MSQAAVTAAAPTTPRDTEKRPTMAKIITQTIITLVDLIWDKQQQLYSYLFDELFIVCWRNILWIHLHVRIETVWQVEHNGF